MSCAGWPVASGNAGEEGWSVLVENMDSEAQLPVLKSQLNLCLLSVTSDKLSNTAGPRSAHLSNEDKTVKTSEDCKLANIRHLEQFLAHYKLFA